MVFLAVGIIFIAGAAVREGNLRTGETPAPGRVRRARVVMAIAAIVVAGILYLGRAWWNSDASNYQRGVNFFKPPAAETKLENGNQLMIRAKGQDAEWSNYVKMEDVISDHGHLMHLFVIIVPVLDRMWHLHPERIAGGAFAQELPSMPAGRYQIFADIVDKDGFPWTLVGSVALTQINGKTLAGGGSVWCRNAVSAQLDDSAGAQLPDRGRRVWQPGEDSLQAKGAVEFKVAVGDKGSQTAKHNE